MRKDISILSRLIAICRNQWLSNISLAFILGILIGVLLGFCAIFNYDNEISPAIKQSISIIQQKQLHSINSNTSILSKIQIQCIIFIHPNQLFKRKYVQTLSDTYTKQCNHTVYVTNSKQILRYFAEKYNIAFVNTMKTQYHWDLYREIIKYSTKYGKQQNSSWTIISDEQTFIVMGNLRKILLTFGDSQQSLILGRTFSKRNLLSYLFPWNIYKTILPEAGIVFSRKALEDMTNDKCFGWLSPRATERALVQCGSLMNVQLIDPIDKEGKHLFIPTGLQELIEGSKLEFSGNTNQSFYWYSDEALSFGNLNYRGHRVLDFTITRIKVFGY
ncbi:Fringe-like family protein [Acanthocheilonema viteae]